MSNTNTSFLSNPRKRKLVPGAIYSVGRSAVRVHGEISIKHPSSFGQREMFLISQADGTVQPIHRDFIVAANKDSRMKFLTSAHKPAKGIANFR